MWWNVANGYCDRSLHFWPYWRFFINCMKQTGFVGLAVALETKVNLTQIHINRYACKYTHMLHVPSHVPCSHLSSQSYSSWQAAWPAWWKWLLSWWCQFIARGLSSPPSPVPKGSPRLEWDKSTTEEAVLGLAHFCCWLVPCAPPAGLFEQPQLVKLSRAWLGTKTTSVWKNRLGGSNELTFCSDT